MITNINFYNELKNYLPGDATINNIELITKDTGVYARISYTASPREIKQFELWYKNRMVDILLQPNQEKLNQGYCIEAISGCADTMKNK